MMLFIIYQMLFGILFREWINLKKHYWVILGKRRRLEYHLLLAHDLKLLQSEDYTQLTERVVELKRMLTALIQKLTADR